MIVICGRFKTSPRQRQALTQLCASLIAPSTAEDGCLSYSFYEDQMEPDSFIFFEEWRDQAAIDNHFEQSYFKDAMERFPDLIIGDPVIKIYTTSNIETL